MSVESKIKTGVDIATLIASSTVTVGGAIATYKMIKDKKGALLIWSGVLVILVGVAASKYSLQKIRSVKNDDTPEK
jgi:hypothetical protein